MGCKSGGPPLSAVPRFNTTGSDYSPVYTKADSLSTFSAVMATQGTLPETEKQLVPCVAITAENVDKLSAFVYSGD